MSAWIIKRELHLSVLIVTIDMMLASDVTMFKAF